jgi:hypothetical protein
MADKAVLSRVMRQDEGEKKSYAKPMENAHDEA